MGTWIASLSTRGRVLLGLVVAVVLLGSFTAGLALQGDGDGDDSVATGATSTTSGSSTSSSSTSTSAVSSTSTSVADSATSTTVPSGPAGTTATTKKPSPGTTVTPPTSPPVTSPPAPTTCNTSSSGNAGSLAAKFCAYRSSNGLATMQRTGAMDAIAQEWANKLAADQNANGGFGLVHRPNDDQRNRVLAACGGCNGWAENLAYATSADGIWNAWLNSPTHLANIRNGQAGEFGIGVAMSNDGYLFAVQNFGRYP